MITKAGMTEYSLAIDEYFENQTSDRVGSGNVYAGGAGEDTVVNYANGTKIVTGKGDDTVTSVAGGVVIDTQDGDDSIIAVGTGINIDAGAGNDKIYSQGTNHYIDKGTGADTVYVSGDSPTFAPNEDDVADTIKTPGFTFQYVKDQGLIMDSRFASLFETEEEEEDEEEESEVTINIYNN